MRRTRTGPTTTPASGEGPGSSVVMACVGHERERAAERAAPQLFIWLWRAESISAALTACGAGHCACKSGSGIRSPSRPEFPEREDK